MSRFSDAITAIKQGLGDRLCIMGHHYQHDDVVRHCDVTGDSLELARRIEGIDAEHIVFCGVYFMGESAALLAKPGQSVHMPAWDANCMMSLMTPAGLARTVLLQLQAIGRKIVPLAYVNTTLALKAVVGEFGGAVCTSANARTMLAWALEEAGPDGAVLFDYNCEGFGLRAIEELASVAAFEPEQLADEAEGILEKHRVFLRGRVR